MKSVVKCIILFACCGNLCVSAHASIVTGKIATLSSRTNDNLHFVLIEGTRSEKPACAAGTYFMIKDEKSDTGKAQYAMLMAAFLADRSIVVAGAGTCARWSDGEDIGAVSYVR